jgi:hypothetical protein
MSKTAESGKSTASARGQGRQIDFDRWLPFLDQFTRENQGAHARLEAFGREAGYQVVTENRPLDGVSADVRDGERSIWIAFGSTPADRQTHGIPDAVVVRFLPAEGDSGAVLEIEGKDGATTLLRLTPPGAFNLSSGAPPR